MTFRQNFFTILLGCLVIWGSFSPLLFAEPLALSPTQRDFFKQHLWEPAQNPMPVMDFNVSPYGATQAPFSSYGGQWIVLNFWATWCVPCIKEMPDLEQLHQQFTNQGMTVITVASGEPENAVAPFVKRYALTLPIYLDPERLVSNQYGATQLPITYLITPQNQVVARAVGARNWAHPQMVQFFQQLIADW